MTELWLVRHGQTDWNLEGRFQGQSDVPLNAAGLAQAEELAAELGGRKFSAVYSSDLKRAYQTAEIIARRVGLSVKVDRRLREICQGEWEGLLLAEVRQRYNQDFSVPYRDTTHSRAPGGESVIEVTERLTRAADDIALAFPAQPVLLISHGLALAALICTAANLPLSEVYSHIPDNAYPLVVEWPPKTL
ncbi:MAG: histidine phosphatase family protein [Anaerolineaceae bacterium]|nr:histidine phosphatase family protein [Anaerolineaceae bacterium]